MLHERETLTQYGRRDGEPAFRRAPRTGLDQGDISMIAGDVTVEQATALVRSRLVEGHPDHAVRFTTVGALRSAGFLVENTPTRMNPEHVSVTWPGDWTGDVCERFESCFTNDVDGGSDD
jgi:hypothetical protein